ncbi:MAG: hypothetical protein PHS44_04755 [Candidatus Dojkabacteria bacterium]|nr:hypothetical protein [Candidatus Dojkabacteria bacterium]
MIVVPEYKAPIVFFEVIPTQSPASARICRVLISCTGCALSAAWQCQRHIQNEDKLQTVRGGCPSLSRRQQPVTHVNPKRDTEETAYCTFYQCKEP